MRKGSQNLLKRGLNHDHQRNLFDPQRARKVVLIGAGSVGSMAALFLAKMGVTDIEVWDGDSVASHNVPMSLYSPKYVGAYKVEALWMAVLELTGVELTTHREHYAGQKLARCSVVVCVDTMQARKTIWDKVKMVPTIDVLCDTRIAEMYAEVLTVEPCKEEDIREYETLLYSDKKAKRQTCGRHGIVTVSTRAAQIVASNLALFWSCGTKTRRIGERCDTFVRAL